MTEIQWPRTQSLVKKDALVHVPVLLQCAGVYSAHDEVKESASEYWRTAMHVNRFTHNFSR